MLDKKDILKLKRFISVLVLIQGTERVYYASLVKAKGDNEPFTQFSSIEDIIEHYGKNSPYSIHLLGSGILTRFIDRSDNYQNDLIITGDKNEFIFNTYTDNKKSLVSFFRSNVVEPEIQILEDNNCHIVSVSGGYAILPLIDLNLNYKGKVEIQCRDNQLVNFEKGTEDSLTGLLRLNNAILAHLSKQDDYFDKTEVVKESKENFKQFLLFKTLGLTIVGVLLMALIVNKIISHQVNNEIADLEARLSISNSNLSLLNRLTEEETRKKVLLNSGGGLSNEYISKYLDDISRTVPQQIDLLKLTVFPIDGNLKDKQKISVDNNVIRVSGEAKNNQILDDWLEQLNRISWLHAVEVIAYSKNEHGIGEFSLLIKIVE